MQFTINKENPPKYSFDGGHFWPLKGLLGLKVIDFKINDAHDNFQIVTDGETFDFYCYGDCCSTSWIENVTGLDSLIGGTVLEISCSDSEDVTRTDDEHEYKDIYTIKTEKGRFDIEFRNSSNGYYGGAIESGLDDDCGELKSLKADF